ncbi:hypothetical protein PQR15_35115 [Streptomyces lydicus]|nr:hypothetical protein [Streptomyces lydicus]
MRTTNGPPSAAPSTIVMRVPCAMASRASSSSPACGLRSFRRATEAAARGPNRRTAKKASCSAMCWGSAQIIGNSAWASTATDSSGRAGSVPPVVRPPPFIRVRRPPSSPRAALLPATLSFVQ